MHLRSRPRCESVLQIFWGSDVWLSSSQSISAAPAIRAREIGPDIWHMHYAPINVLPLRGQLDYPFNI